MISHLNVEYLHNPMWSSHHDFFCFYIVPTYVESYWFLYLFIADVLCFVLRSYVHKILGLYHFLMYVCRLHQFLVPRFFCLYRLPTYVDPHVFLVLRSYVCKILGLNHVLMYEMYVVDFYCLGFLCLFRIPMYVELYLFCSYWIPT